MRMNVGRKVRKEASPQIFILRVHCKAKLDEQNPAVKGQAEDLPAPPGRGHRLIDALEQVVCGTQQKQSEQRVCNAELKVGHPARRRRWQARRTCDAEQAQRTTREGAASAAGYEGQELGDNAFLWSRTYSFSPSREPSQTRSSLSYNSFGMG